MNAAQLFERARAIHPWGLPGLFLMCCVVALSVYCMTEIGASLWNWAGDLRRRKRNHSAADKVLLPPLFQELRTGLAAVGATERPIAWYLRHGPQDQSLAERTIYCVAQVEFLRRTHKEVLRADARLADALNCPSPLEVTKQVLLNADADLTAALKANHAQLGRADLLQRLQKMRTAAHSGQREVLDSLVPRAAG